MMVEVGADQDSPSSHNASHDDGLCRHTRYKLRDDNVAQHARHRARDKTQQGPDRTGHLDLLVEERCVVEQTLHPMSAYLPTCERDCGTDAESHPGDTADHVHGCELSLCASPKRKAHERGSVGVVDHMGFPEEERYDQQDSNHEQRDDICLVSRALQ